MKYKCILAGVAFLLAGSFGAQGQSIHTLPQGTKLSGTVEFGRFMLPLPPGDWTLIGAMTDKPPATGGIITPPVAAAFLALIEDGTIVGTVEATGSVDPQRISWGASNDCKRTDFWQVEADKNFNLNEQDCRYVTHQTMDWVGSTNAREYYKDAMQWLRSQNIKRPQQMLRSSHRRVRHGDMMTVNFQVNPEYFGQKEPANPRWAASDWHSVNYPHIPERAAFAQAWLDWSRQMTPAFVDGYGKKKTLAPAFPFTPPRP
jgi:hypothetical protein